MWAKVWLSATYSKIFLGCFSNFGLQQYTVQKTSETCPNERCSWLQKMFQTYSCSVFEGFSKLEGNNLLWLGEESLLLQCLPYCCFPDYESFKGNNYQTAMDSFGHWIKKKKTLGNSRQAVSIKATQNWLWLLHWAIFSLCSYNEISL